MTPKEHDDLWREMMKLSFSPRQWFEPLNEPDDQSPDSRTQTPAPEATLMWVYVKSEKTLYTVGFYDPKGIWHPDSDHPTLEDAAARVHFLNGGADLKAA